MRKTTLTVLWVLVMTRPIFGDPHIKEPNVSGQFYSADARQLSSQLDRFMEDAKNSPMDKDIQVVIAPHAGYVYSGGVAAYGFKAVSQKKFKTVVILAPSHFFPFEGVSVWPEGGFKTPLGTVPVDSGFARELLAADSRFVSDPAVFEREHSLEVEIPFVQRTFPGASIVPVIMGQPKYETCEALAEALNGIIGGRRDVLIVVSTDMSHYHDDASARKMDKATLETVAALDARSFLTQCYVGKIEMCGFVPVTTAMIYAGLRGLKAEVLRYSNSGDVTGDTARVVGYSSIVMYKDDSAASGAPKTEEGALTMDEKKVLLDLAQRTVETFVRTGKAPAVPRADARLKEVQGAFVTIHKKGELRGCIGRIIADQPLIDTVRDMAVAAASQDPRFPPVTEKELQDLEVEVSVLSRPVLAKSPEEIVMGKHGVIVSRGPFRKGVFLPQVATDTGWSREEFLSELCSQKAGLAPDAWKDPRTTLEIFTADVFSAKDLGE